MEDLEKKVSVSMGREVEVFSYVDDIHIGVYGSTHGKEEEHGGWVERVDEGMGEVSRECAMLTAPDKHERLVVEEGEGRKKKSRKDVKWVKWLGIIMDEDLSFDTHLQKWVEKARNLLGALKGIGNSEWGLSSREWRQICIGMIRTVATWGAEWGWQGQKRWVEKLEKLQYDSLRRCMGAVKGTRKEKIRTITGVEGVSTYLDGVQARFVARMAKEKYLCGMV